jgi:hypothetical protein
MRFATQAFAKISFFTHERRPTNNHARTINKERPFGYHARKKGIRLECFSRLSEMVLTEDDTRYAPFAGSQFNRFRKDRTKTHSW